MEKLSFIVDFHPLLFEVALLLTWVGEWMVSCCFWDWHPWGLVDFLDAVNPVWGDWLLLCIVFATGI